jgi:hypothetical protein
MLPNSTEDLWDDLMHLDQYSEKPPPKKDEEAESVPSGRYPVSRFGSLLATSLIRLPTKSDHRVIEEYPRHDHASNIVS